MELVFRELWNHMRYLLYVEFVSLYVKSLYRPTDFAKNLLEVRVPWPKLCTNEVDLMVQFDNM